MIIIQALQLIQNLALTGQASCGDNAVCDPGLPVVDASSTQLSQILSIVFAIVAALAVLFIVIAGLRFVLAQGDPQDVAKARSTIIYALVGLLVALAAEAIVALALNHL